MKKRIIGLIIVQTINLSLFSNQWDFSELNGEYTGDSFFMRWNPGTYLNDTKLKLGFEAGYGYTWGEDLNEPFYQAFLGGAGLYLQYDETYRIATRAGNFASPVTFIYGTMLGAETTFSYNYDLLYIYNLSFIGSITIPDNNNSLMGFVNQFTGEYTLWESISHSFGIKLKADFFHNIDSENDSAYGLEFLLPLVLFDRSSGSTIPEFTITPRVGVMSRQEDGINSSSGYMNYNSSNIFSIPRDKSGDFVDSSGDFFLSLNSSFRYYPFNNRTIPVAEWFFLSGFNDLGWIYTKDNNFVFSTTTGLGIGMSIMGFFDLGIDITYNQEIGFGYLIGIGFLK